MSPGLLSEFASQGVKQTGEVGKRRKGGRKLGWGGRGEGNNYFKCSQRHGYTNIVQGLCESRGPPGLSVLTSLLVSVDVKLY